MNIAIMGEGPWVGVLVRKIERLHCQTILYRDVKESMERVVRLLMSADLSIFWIGDNQWDLEFELGVALALGRGTTSVIVHASPMVVFSKTIEEAMVGLGVDSRALVQTFDDFLRLVVNRVRMAQ